MGLNIPSQIVVQTAEEWAADSTVYSEKRLLVTSDEYFLAPDVAISYTNQRRFKIADGIHAWYELDYPLDPAGVYIQLQAEIAERNNEDDAIRADITNEAVARQEADTILQNTIDENNGFFQNFAVTKGVANGLAELDGSGNVPTLQLANVLSVALTGLSAASGTPIATDTILQAFGKAKYFIDNIATTILSQVLTGFSVAGSRTAIVAGDNILGAFGKIQKYLNDLGAAAYLNVGTAAGTVAAGDDSRFFGEWIDFTGTINLTGFSGTPTVTFARYKESSSGYWVHLSFSGGSNAATMTGDLPFSNALGSAFTFILPATNSGGSNISRNSIASGSSTITFGNSTTGGSWTAIGIKGVNGIFFIPKL